MENFEAQRAAIMAELTQAALTGGDTAKAREKLTRLAEREAQAAEAERERAEAQRQQAEADMAARAAELATEAIERLRADGIDVADTDAQNLQAYARTVARHEAEIQTAGDAYVLAQSKVQQVQDRIAALSERAAALSALRLTGQATDRDTGEAVLIERDLQTLREALTPAQAAQARVQVPDAMQHQHQASRPAVAAYMLETARALIPGRAAALTRHHAGTLGEIAHQPPQGFGQVLPRHQAAAHRPIGARYGNFMLLGRYELHRGLSFSVTALSPFSLSCGA